MTEIFEETKASRRAHEFISSQSFLTRAGVSRAKWDSLPPQSRAVVIATLRDYADGGWPVVEVIRAVSPLVNRELARNGDGTTADDVAAATAEAAEGASEDAPERDYDAVAAESLEGLAEIDCAVYGGVVFKDLEPGRCASLAPDFREAIVALYRSRKDSDKIAACIMNTFCSNDLGGLIVIQSNVLRYVAADPNFAGADVKTRNQFARVKRPSITKNNLSMLVRAAIATIAVRFPHLLLKGRGPFVIARKDPRLPDPQEISRSQAVQGYKKLTKLSKRD
jgi:hypothetical protein